MPQRLGQHFLEDKNALSNIAMALNIKPGETIIEIGPGHGELTEELLAMSEKWAASSPQIIAVEKDPKLVKTLREKFADKKNLEIAEGDIRTILPTRITSHASLPTRPYKLCGNIPYYLTGFLLRLIGECKPLPRVVVLLLQKEVAERVCAEPKTMNLVKGNPPSGRASAGANPNGMNKLAASVGFWGKAEMLFQIPAEAFNPPPKINSAVIKILPSEKQGDEAKYFAAVRALFEQPRKTILNNLSSSLQIPKERLTAMLEIKGINPSDRPQSLSIAQIHVLSSFF